MNKRKPTRRTSTEDVETIRKLSKEHTVRQIAKLTGISKQMIIGIQNNAKNEIVDPKRRQASVVKKVKTKENYFDIDAYARLFIY